LSNINRDPNGFKSHWLHVGMFWVFFSLGVQFKNVMYVSLDGFDNFFEVFKFTSFISHTQLVVPVCMLACFGFFFFGSSIQECYVRFSRWV
jgi:hypothetical protein